MSEFDEVKCRKEFEAWLAKEWPWHAANLDLVRDERVYSKWECWLAASKLAWERNGWTPVSEGYPQNSGYVDVTISDGTETITEEAYWCDGKWMGLFCEEDNAFVIAWRPKPEPYKEKRP